MMTLKKTRKLFFTTLVCSLLVAISGCSSDEKEAANTTKKEVHDPFDHSHETPVTDVQKHKFEHDFAQQCVTREANDPKNTGADKMMYQQACMCIAQYMMKDLTAAEAEKFLQENEHPQSLRIKFDAAAYECLQEKTAQIKGPKLFGKN